ncbi:MAG: TetR/AcrR family transcriptional regulator [Solirubrobacteraceae bacterium]|jgi:AcrR family transcriptional regulator
MAIERGTVPRGRHAPPLEVRREVQRQRLFEAAATVFARIGYADASAESISREAGMSKATFYEHFANKEVCILALFDEGARAVLGAMAEATASAGDDPRERMRAGIRAFLQQLASHRNESQTLLVEIIGAGPRATERRDAILQTFADALYDEAGHAARREQTKGFASHEDAFAVIAAGAELASRHVRLGVPADARELEPVLERLLLGALSQNR